MLSAIVAPRSASIRSTWSGPGWVKPPLGPKSDSGVGHVDGTVRSDRNVVEELGPTSDGHVGDRRAGALVERAHGVDVGHPERVAA